MGDSPVTQAEAEPFSLMPQQLSGSRIDESTSNDETTGLSIDTSTISQPTFIENYWPYLLFALIFVGWILSRLFTRREPSFRPATSQAKKEPPIDNSAGEQAPESLKPRGQFKKSERFLKPKNKEETKELVAAKIQDASEAKDDPSGGEARMRRSADPSAIEGKLTENQQADTMQFDQPGDEEFDFDLTEEGADSDVFSFDDPVETEETAADKTNQGSSKRFKTEADGEEPSVKLDELAIDDDSFDDEDSQLSLADSDAEFGFDLDDEEPNNFLDSDNKVAEATPKSRSS